MSRERLFGRLALEGGRWVLTTSETHVVIRLKQIFPRVAKYASGSFAFQDDEPHAHDLRWMLSRYPMAMTPADRRALHARSRAYQATLAEMEAILKPGWTPPPVIGLRPGQVGRTYQMQAVALAVRSGGLLVGDAIGTGKTYLGLLLALQPGMLPMAAVVQPHVQGQWAEKAAEFTTLRTHLIETTRPYVLPEADLYLFRYSNIFGWTTEFAKGLFRSALYDELQELRTGTGTAKGAAAQTLSANVDVRLGLSATPIFNRKLEIHPVLGFVKGRDGSHPLGTLEEFEREWTDGEKVRDSAALGSHLREVGAFLRRTKRDVGQAGAAPRPIMVEVPYDAREERRIEDLARALAIKTVAGAFMERGSAGRELDILMRQATGVAKAKGVADFVRMLLEEGRQVLVGLWHRSVYEVLMRELAEFSPCMYTGSESPRQKAESKRRFVAGESRAMLISLRSGASLDGLQHVCSDVVVGEFDWSPPVHGQLIGRVDREGQRDPVNAFFCHADSGSDPAMIEMLGLKASDIASIVDPGDADLDLDVSPAIAEGRIKHLARSWLARRGIVVEARELEPA